MLELDQLQSLFCFLPILHLIVQSLYTQRGREQISLLSAETVSAILLYLIM